MLEKNTKQVNKIISYSLAGCSLAMIVLLFLNHIGFFHYTKGLYFTIKYLGLFVTLSPFVLYKIKISDTVLKYYMLIIMAVLIGVMGTFTGIGIYISYVLVPIASCLYFDKKLTYVTAAFSYCMMVMGVWVNTSVRWEVLYKNWTHQRAFTAYIIGFTIEYIIAMLFVVQFVRRAEKVMMQEHKAYTQLKADEQKYRMLSAGIKDIVFELDANTGSYSANRSIYIDKVEDNGPVFIPDLNAQMLIDDEKSVNAIKTIMSTVKEGDSVIKDIDLSYMRGEKKVPLWFSLESTAVKDEDCKEIRYIGRLHNITSSKLNMQSANRNRLSAMLSDSMRGRSSAVRRLLSETDNLSENDFVHMAQSHQLLAGIAESLRSTADTDAAMDEALKTIAVFMGVDRIVGLYGIDENNCSIGFQWCINTNDRVKNDFSFMTGSDIEIIKAVYDKIGYIEINPANNISMESENLTNDFYKGLIVDNILGAQFWVPTLHEGEYTGAVFFDKYDTTPYTMAEKFLMIEAVNILSSHVAQVRAEELGRAKTAYLSNMSHEIRTPMNAILGMSEVALRQDMPADVRKCLQTIRSSANGLLGIINDILDFSKIEAGKVDIIYEEYATLSIVNDTYSIATARNQDKKLNLVYHISEKLPRKLYGDSVRVKQVMLNLVNNAIKYTNEGSVEVYLDGELLSDGKLKLKYRVEDTGQGIKDEDKHRIFSSYGQVNIAENHHKEGTGLGLAISKQLIELMDGTIFFESKYGKGSTFGFEIIQDIRDDAPCGKFTDYSYEDESVPSDNMSFKARKAKVLLVDDNEINREVAKMLLEPIELQIEEADDGTTAVNITKKEKFDLILMDHFMPVMDGVEATKAIRADKTNPNVDTPIVALTADAVSGVRDTLLSIGMNDFMSKPIDSTIACQKLRKWLPKELIEEA